MSGIRVLFITSEWPCEEFPTSGIFVQRQISALVSAGIDASVFAFRGRASLGPYLRALFELRRRLAREEYDLIHAHFGQAGFLACLAARIPVVVTFHGSDVFGLGRSSGDWLKSALLQGVSRIAAHLASGVITVSQEIKEALGISSAHVIPMGIDEKLFRPMARNDARAQLGWPLNERTVLFVGGRENPVKRFGLAQDAVAEASSILSSHLELRVCENAAPETMPLYFNAADVLVITSEHEGSPVRLREALACNLPVVSVDVGDARARLGRVPGCILTDSAMPEVIASALVNVLKDRIRVNGADGISDLDEKAIAHKLVSVYEEVRARGRSTIFAC